MQANIDQSAFAFRLDVALTLFDEGCIAVVPVDASFVGNGIDIVDVQTLRVGRIVQWYPQKVKVRLYNESVGTFQEVVVDKRHTAIIENPLYSVMNEPNSTLKRLVRKLNLLDSADEDALSGKLDLIIQLPYVVKNETRIEQAGRRRKDIEMQLSGSKYGIAYVDGTEKITQLNRPVDNNLLAKIQDLRGELYGQLGLTEEVIKGNASESAMLVFHEKTVAPILTAICNEFTRKLINSQNRQQGQRIVYYRDPFKLVTLGDMAEIADKLTRNKVATSNELRGVMGWLPSDDPSADKLENSNIKQPTEGG